MQEGTSSQGEGDVAPAQRSRHSYHLSQGHAAVELFLRLSRARQTLDFAKRQVCMSCKWPGVRPLSLALIWGILQPVAESRAAYSTYLPGSKSFDLHQQLAYCMHPCTAPAGGHICSIRSL